MTRRDTTSAPTICLNMIVKDEAPIIRRCLDSVRPFIDTWCIVDTGSSDGTQDVIREHMKDVPGELFERPWKNFGHNRTEALELARGRADYALVMDADDVLSLPVGFTRPLLDQDAYSIRIVAGTSGTTFHRIQLVRLALPWRYVGVLHEVVECPDARPTVPLDGPVITSMYDGARNVDPVAKYTRDAEILEAGLKDEPDNTRYVFYLAQSYRDSKQLEKSLAAYERRVAMGGWAEEVWYSMFQIGVIKQRMQRPWHEVQAAYLDAYQYRPTRAEPLIPVAAYYRTRNEHAIAHLFARAAATTPRPADILFLDESVYAWRALDELAIASFWIGNPAEALALNDRLLSLDALPPSEKPRIEENRRFCLQALGRNAG